MEKNESTDSKRKYFGIIKDISIAIFFIVLTFCVIEIKTLLLVEVKETRKDTFIFLDTTTNKLDNRINSIENKLFNRVGSIENKLFSRIDSIEKNTFTSVKNIETEVISLSQDYRSIPQGTQKLFSRLDNQTNCELNDYCWQNLTSDLLIDTRNTVRETSKTFQTEIPKITKDVSQMTNTFNNKFPVIVDNTTRITDNAQKFTENMDKLTKPRWYDRMIGWGVNSSIIYFNLRRFR